MWTGIAVDIAFGGDSDRHVLESAIAHSQSRDSADGIGLAVSRDIGDLGLRFFRFQPDFTRAGPVDECEWTTGIDHQRGFAPID
jgi:hypothetical protein